MHRHLLAALAISTALTAPALAQKQSVAIYDATASEELGKAPLKICKLGTDRKSAFDVHLNVTGSSTDTAKAGTDFVPIEDLHLDFPAVTGLICQTVDLRLVQDQVPEPSKFVTATIAAGKGARLYDGKAKITITDSDPSTKPCPDGSAVAWNAVCPPPPPPPITCPDGTEVPAGQTCPPPPPVQCPDGTTVPAGQTCPVSPPPTGTGSGVAAEGDSISVFWAQNHTGIFAAAHPEVKVTGFAVSGSGLGALAARSDKVLAANPKVLTVLIGANDLYNWQRTAEQWLAQLWTYTDAMRAKGIKVAVGTVLPRCGSGDGAAYDTEHNKRRNTVANPGIRGAVGVHIDAAIDYAADPVMGPDSAACDKNLYQDGLHPTDGNSAKTGGQNKLAAIYTPVVERLLGIGGTVPPPPPPPGPVDPVTGAPAIPSNFDINTTLKPAWGTGAIPGTGAPDVVGAFRFICGPGQLSYDDPIVYPGQPGKSHLHQYYGNTGTNANSTFASLRASGDSTCNNMGNGTAANRSAYWVSAMLDGKGNVVQPEYVTVYYKREPVGSPQCTKGSSQYLGECIGIPNALKFISGFDTINGKPGVQQANFKCLTSNGSTLIGAVQSTLAALKTQGCVVGGFVAMGIQSPKCWNGQLDSPDHRSHLAGVYFDRNTGKRFCPTTHPKVMPQFTIVSFYRIRTGDDLSLWSLSSDHMYPSLPAGTTAHFDYFEAWDVPVKDMWVNNCIGKLLNCSGGDLGNGLQLKGAASGAINKPPSYRVAISSIPLPGH